MTFLGQATYRLAAVCGTGQRGAIQQGSTDAERQRRIEHLHRAARAATGPQYTDRQIQWVCESVSCILWCPEKDLPAAAGPVNNGHFLQSGDFTVYVGKDP